MEKEPTLVILRCDDGAPIEIENSELAEILNEFSEGLYNCVGNDDKHYASIFEKYNNIIVKPVTIKNFKDVIRSICPDPRSDDFVFFNICDGVDIDGLPGRSVAKFLEDEKYFRYPFDLAFSRICSHKIETKLKLDEFGVSTAPWVLIDKTWNEDKRKEVLKLKFPLIVKVSDFYGSLGITNASRCETIEQVEAHIQSMIPLYGRVFVEEFITGREFTVLLIDEKDGGVFVYPPAEFIFPQDLPLKERFLNHYMETKDEQAIEEKFGLCSPELAEPLKALSIAAYKALGGKKYARLDIRQNIETGIFYVLEINDLPTLCPGGQADHLLSLSGLSLKDFGKKIMELTPYH